MKILIISLGRSGSTYVYNSCIHYTNPELVDHQGRADKIWDECIMEDTPVDELNLLTKDLEHKENWTVKLHKCKINPITQDYFYKIAEMADIVVEVVRKDVKATAISYSIAQMTGKWEMNNVGNSYSIPKEIFIDNLRFINENLKVIFDYPFDKCLTYEELKNPREIYSSITDIPVESLEPMIDYLQKNLVTVINQEQVDIWYDEFLER